MTDNNSGRPQSSKADTTSELRQILKAHTVIEHNPPGLEAAVIAFDNEAEAKILELIDNEKQPVDTRELDDVLREVFIEIEDTLGPMEGTDSRRWRERIEESVAAQKQRWVEKAEVESLLKFRKLYDDYEMRHTTDFEGNKIATWSGYKWFRNPLSDHIEEITGVRSDQDVEKWLADLDGVIGEPGNHQSSKKLKAVTKLRKNEQTETDELFKILQSAIGKYVKFPENLEPEDVAEQIAALEAWSRQQTAQVLDKLSKHHFIADNETTFSGRIELVFKSSIDAELAALRVGLEGKHGDSK